MDSLAGNTTWRPVVGALVGTAGRDWGSTAGGKDYG